MRGGGGVAMTAGESTHLLSQPRRESCVEDHPGESIRTNKSDPILLGCGTHIARVPNKEHAMHAVHFGHPPHIVIELGRCRPRLDLHECSLLRGGKDQLDVDGVLDTAGRACAFPATGREYKVNQQLEVLPGQKTHQPGNRGNHLRFCLQCSFDLGCNLVPKLSEQVIFCINPANRTAKSLNFQEAA